MENNKLSYTKKIKDFTGWGYGVISWYRFVSSDKEEQYTCKKDNSEPEHSEYVDSQFRCVILNKGLYGWGNTAIDAYLKAKKIEKSRRENHHIEYRRFLQFYKHYLTCYRISPRAKEYLDNYGFYDDNKGYTDLYLVRVPFTIDNNGYPVTYIIDLVDDKFKEKMNIPVLKIINYQNGDSEKYFGKYGTLIKHDVKSIRHKIPKITNTNISNTWNIDSSEYNYAVLSSGEIVYGLGRTPEKAFMDAINNFNNYFKTIKNKSNIEKSLINFEKHCKKKFKLFFKIVPLSTRAKNYIKVFGGFTSYPDYSNSDNSLVKYYKFHNEARIIPPIMLENGYPVDVVIDLADDKAIAVTQTIKKFMY